MRTRTPLRSPFPFPTRVKSSKILIDVAKGLQYLHSRDPYPVIHRDIKPDNVLLSGKAGAFKASIADLGEARTVEDSHVAMTRVGTNGYTAPEVLRGTCYSTPCDVFSFAIVIWETLALQSPYQELRVDPETGNRLASWSQILEMTITEDLVSQHASNAKPQPN